MPKISIAKKMSFAKFKETYGPLVNMTDSPKKDKFLVDEWKRNIKEIDEAEELIAKQKLELETEIVSIEKGIPEEEKDEEEDQE